MGKYVDLDKLVFEPDENGVANGVYVASREQGKTMRLILVALRKMIEGLPIEDVKPVVHGRWIEHSHLEVGGECSICGWQFQWFENAEAHYCPHCGAKMDLEV